MRILLTGATGFAGAYLAEALLARGGVTLAAVARGADWPAVARHLAGRVALAACDLGDRAAVEAVLREARPEQVYHLAGYASPGRSFEEPDAAWAGNLQATRALYDALARWGGRPRVLFVGSGLIYGGGGPDGRQDEDAPLRPTSPYAASKAAADLLSYQVTRAPGLDVVRARPFNHIGPRQSAEYAVAAFARQIVAIERGRRPPVLETGDLSPHRDFTDVRDTVEAYTLLMDKGRTGEAYNVASGRSCSMQEVLDRLLALAGLAVEVRRRGELVRAAESTVVRVDAGKLRRETGWAPRHTLDQTLADTLAYWRSQ
jgi:GDP-4-dehydro-6-deoxy-D-mannose reductase